MTGSSYIIEIGVRPILLHMISYHFSYVRMWEIFVKALKWPQNTKDRQTRRRRNDNTGRIPTKTGWTWQKVTVTDQATYVRDKVGRENRGISIRAFLRWCLMRFWWPVLLDGFWSGHFEQPQLRRPDYYYDGKCRISVTLILTDGNQNADVEQLSQALIS